MLLQFFYDTALAHASYMVGCQQTGEAVVIDPSRDIQQYLDVADQKGMRIVGAAETHIHADFVSVSRELAERVGAKLYLSDEGPEDWKYMFADQYASQLLRGGDHFSVGKVRFDVLHTPGHTPESISFQLTDVGGGATEPMGIFTGDFVFVGSIGRPDLLEEAAGVVGSAEQGARDLFRSVQRFNQLPEFLQIWPAHGAGSACGKGLGAIPSSTVGYEKRFNPALNIPDEGAFVRYILADQPEAPRYFAVMKRVNKLGPRLLPTADLPGQLPARTVSATAEREMVLDLSSPERFARGHVPRSINMPHRLLANWAGWIINYDRPVYLIAEKSQLAEAFRVLRKIGVDDIAGYFAADEVDAAGANSETYESRSPGELSGRIAAGEVMLVDVRSDAEWNAGHVPEARHMFLGTFPERAAELPTDKPIVVQCLSGGRSAIAASILQAAYFSNVINLSGGYQAWLSCGLPTVRPVEEQPTLGSPQIVNSEIH